jgi:hypothetical protein
MRLGLAGLLTLSSVFAQPGATIRVHVIDSVNKSPIPGAKVTIGSVAKPDRGELEAALVTMVSPKREPSSPAAISSG